MPCLAGANAHQIADAFLAVRYDGDRDHETFFERTTDAFENLLLSARIYWAPDGDEAFDDGSYVLEMDQSSGVRLIAFTRTRERISRLRDVRMPSDEFYNILSDWHVAFNSECEERLAIV